MSMSENQKQQKEKARQEALRDTMGVDTTGNKGKEKSPSDQIDNE